MSGAKFEHFLTDREVAELLKVSVSTVKRLIRQGPNKPGRMDLRLCEPLVIGGVRRWPRTKLYQMLGIA